MVEDAGLQSIAEAFAAYFASWEIRIPHDKIAGRRAGHLNKAGWDIRWIFGEEDNDEYLEFYACHRMTNDRRLRLYASGRQQSMAAAQQMMVFPTNATNEDKQRIEAEYFEYNRAIAEELRQVALRG